MKTISLLASLEVNKVSSFNYSTKATISVSNSSQRMIILFNLSTLGKIYLAIKNQSVDRM